MSDRQVDLAEYYDNEALAEARGAVTGRRAEVRLEFVELLKAESRRTVLDIGAGPGRDGHFLLDHGFSYLGYDLAFNNAALARSRGISVLQASLFHPPIRQGVFDAGWTWSTLLHVPDADFAVAVEAVVAPIRPGAPVAIGLWGGMDREWVNERDRFDPPRFFSLRSHERLRVMLAPFGTIERFETWPDVTSTWEYQFVVLRLAE